MIPDRIWNLEMLGFGGEGKKLGYSEKNLPELRAKERTNIKLNPYMTSTPGLEPIGERWVLSPLRHPPSNKARLVTL